MKSIKRDLNGADLQAELEGEFKWVAQALDQELKSVLLSVRQLSTRLSNANKKGEPCTLNLTGEMQGRASTVDCLCARYAQLRRLIYE